eukprot:TRINITY_DN10_c3_g1_i1.p1 TRINITY_DN10_c3_g1~~TRINITY_DN10_c3_g1_i1.p1  ORF type:complete len:405 (+),score=130.47 TRINITY_DN10_c3_g1_i1:77-1216(+)
MHAKSFAAAAAAPSAAAPPARLDLGEDSAYGTDEVHSGSSDAASTVRRLRGPPQSQPSLAAVPWLQHLERPGRAAIPMADELTAFADFVSLTPRERADRNLVRTALQQLAQTLWAEATAKVYGSFAYGLSLPESDLDVVIEDCTPGFGNLSGFLGALVDQGYEICGSIESERDAFVKARYIRSGVTVNITLTVEKSPVRQAVALVKQALQAYPAAGAVIVVLRAMLRQCSLTDVRKGGLTSYGITLLVFHLLHRAHPEGCDAATLLRSFFRYYGSDFDWKNSVVTADGSADAAKKSGGQVVIADPLDPDNNIAEGFTKVSQVRAMLKYCGLAIDKWSDEGTTDEPEYIGRTALSSIISHKSLPFRCAARFGATAAAGPK